MDIADNDSDDEEGFTTINVAPLVDIALVLVLIFMVTSPTFTKALIAVQLPEAVTSSAEHDKNITVSISTEEGYALNDLAVKKTALAQDIKTIMKDTGLSYLLIRADERVPHGEVEDVMTIGKKCGVKRIAFAVEPKQQ